MAHPSWLSLPLGSRTWPEPLLLRKKEAVFLASDPCCTRCGCSEQRPAGWKGLRRVVGRAGGVLASPLPHPSGHGDVGQAHCYALSPRDDHTAGLSQGWVPPRYSSVYTSTQSPFSQTVGPRRGQGVLWVPALRTSKGWLSVSVSHPKRQSRGK